MRYNIRSKREQFGQNTQIEFSVSEKTTGNLVRTTYERAEDPSGSHHEVPLELHGFRLHDLADAYHGRGGFA
jgi:hypothetical protein